MKNEPLWLQAQALVDGLLHSLARDGLLRYSDITDDLRQDALLAAGEAIPRFDPAKAAFSTYIVAWMRGAILTARRKEARGGITGSWEMPVHTAMTDRESGVLVEDLLAMASSHSPEDLAGVQQVRERVRLALSQVGSDREREAVARVYGIGCEAEGAAGYAARVGVPQRTVESWLENAKEKLAVRLADLYKTET